MSEIFVFGSNLAGRHGAGAALTAAKEFGAQRGIGVGRTGNAYAIPTKDEYIRVLPIERIAGYVAEFIQYANDNGNLKFYVTRVGCGLAGYVDEQIAPLFRGAPSNCDLPTRWIKLIQEGCSA